MDPIQIPLRKLIPPVGMLDLSPIILIIVVQLLGRMIISLLGSIG
jgi:YggT family protein